MSYGFSQLYKFNRNTEQVDYLFDLHGEPYGITWDGSYLWIGSGDGNVYGYDLNGSQVGSFSVPFGSYPAITFNGSNFIVRQPWNDSAEFHGFILWARFVSRRSNFNYCSLLFSNFRFVVLYFSLLFFVCSLLFFNVL